MMSVLRHTHVTLYSCLAILGQVGPLLPPTSMPKPVVAVSEWLAQSEDVVVFASVGHVVRCVVALTF